MCAIKSDMPSVRPDGAGGADAPGRNGQKFEDALERLREGIAARKTESICTAYLALRRSANGTPIKQVLERVDQAHEGNGTGFVVSAFSHRRCFMCDDGTAICPTCEGTGAVNHFGCPTCDGLGVVVCEFCQGAAWSDLHDVPAEIRRQVRHRWVAHVKKDLPRLAKMPPEKVEALAGQLPPDRRRQIAGWLLRLQARLNKLAGKGAQNGDQFAARCRSLSVHTGEILRLLRPKPPQRPKPADTPPPPDEGPT